jgi:hypothetical protein
LHRIRHAVYNNGSMKLDRHFPVWISGAGTGLIDGECF